MTDWISNLVKLVLPDENDEANDQNQQVTSGNHSDPSDPDRPVSLSTRVQELLIDDLSRQEEDALVQEINIPTVFNWAHGGRKVYLVTSLDDWESRHKMGRSQADFSKILHLPTGRKIQYRFEVDGRLLCDPEQKHVRGADGGYVNEIFVESTSHESFVKQNASTKNFTQVMPDPDDYVREPPHAPAHLGNIILNNPPPKGRNPVSLPVPSHVILNHIYVAERKDVDVVVLGMTQRFQSKTFTTVYYKHVSTSPSTLQQQQDSNQSDKNYFFY